MQLMSARLLTGMAHSAQLQVPGSDLLVGVVQVCKTGDVQGAEKRATRSMKSIILHASLDCIAQKFLECHVSQSSSTNNKSSETHPMWNWKGVVIFEIRNVHLLASRCLVMLMSCHSLPAAKSTCVEVTDLKVITCRPQFLKKGTKLSLSPSLFLPVNVCWCVHRNFGKIHHVELCTWCFLHIHNSKQNNQVFQYFKTGVLFLLNWSGSHFGLKAMFLGHPLLWSWHFPFSSSLWKAGVQICFRSVDIYNSFLIFWNLLCHCQNVFFPLTWVVRFCLWLINFIHMRLAKHSHLIVLPLIVNTWL